MSAGAAEGARRVGKMAAVVTAPPLHAGALQGMADELDDRQLLAAYAGRSEQDAFARLVRRHVRFVYACALRQARDPATAEDVTQTVFTLLARQAHTLSDRRGSLRGWLFGVARYA